MEQTQPDTDGPLSQHNARFSPRGLLIRYAVIRARMYYARMFAAAGLTSVLAVIFGPFWPLVFFVLYLITDKAETTYLRGLPERLENGTPLAKAKRIIFLFSVLYAGSVCGFAAIPYVQMHTEAGAHEILAEPFFALCIVLGPALSAALDLRYVPLAASVRLLMLSLLPFGLTAHILLQNQTHGADLQLMVAGLVAFFFTQIWFVVMVQKRHRNSRRNLRSQALQRQALEDAYMRLFDQKQEARRLAMIAEHANDGVMLIGRDGIVRWANDGFSRLTGYTFDELVGQNPGKILNSENTDPAALRVIEAGREKGEPFRAELINRRKDGKDIWIETNQVPVFDDTGQIETYIAVERDVTATKEYERQLKEARLAAEEGARIKEEFLATMSHEFRTPMNGVIGMAQMLQATDLSEDQRLYTDTILGSSRALLALINDVLDLSHMNAAGVSLFNVDFDLHACVGDIVRLLSGQADEKHLELSVEIDPDVPVWVTGDDRRLRQILVNLLGNAVKFTTSGSIFIRLRGVVTGDQVALKIEVEDTGIGIPADKLEKIFERFSQADNAISRKYGGSGLGLSISRGLAQAMGGDIDVTSVEGEGACFTLMLNMGVADCPSIVADEAEDADSLPALDQLQGLRLLVAEDNRVNRLLIRKFLDNAPLELRFATNGAEAQELAKRFRPQVILMDMSMPEVNGLEATRAIRSFDITQPYIAALTANVDETSRQACVDAGMDTFLSKPLSRKELLNLLLTFSERARASERG
jgi:PAS domain S-box-containing protein